MKVANNLLSSLNRFTISDCDSDCCSKSSDSSDCCSSCDCGVDRLRFPRNSCAPLCTAHTIRSLTISHWTHTFLLFCQFVLSQKIQEVGGSLDPLKYRQHVSPRVYLHPHFFRVPETVYLYLVLTSIFVIDLHML